MRAKEKRRYSSDDDDDNDDKTSESSDSSVREHSHKHINEVKYLEYTE